MEPQEPGATPYDGYIPGSNDPSGREIQTVVGRHRHMIVYTTVDHAVHWNYDQMPDRLRPAVAEFQSLTGLAVSCLSKKRRGAAEDLLGPALYAALLSPEGQDPKQAFVTAREYIHRKSIERARIYYVLFSLLVAFVFLAVALELLLATAQDALKLIAVGVSGGVIGAAISIVQRGWKLAIDPLDSVLQVASQGLVRVVLGGVFGAVFVALSKANLMVGSAADNRWALFGLSAAAGISERFVPDLLERSS